MRPAHPEPPREVGDWLRELDRFRRLLSSMPPDIQPMATRLLEQAGTSVTQAYLRTRTGVAKPGELIHAYLAFRRGLGELQSILDNLHVIRWRPKPWPQS